MHNIHLHLQAEARHGEILGQLLYAAKIVAEKEGILDGFRVVINSGPSACKLVSCAIFSESCSIAYNGPHFYSVLLISYSD